MTESANLRGVRVQYLYVDQNDAALRDVRLNYLAVDRSPVSVRRINAQMLTVSEDPTNLRDTRLQYLESVRNPVSLRRVLGQALVVAKAPANLRDVRAQTLAVTRDPVSVRRIHGQVLLWQKDPVLFRGLRAQFMVLENTPPNFTVVAWERLLEIINQNNNTIFQLGEVLPGVPQVSERAGTWNTQLEVTATPASGYSGSVTVYYERYPIELAFQGISPTMDLSAAETTHDILDQINAFFGLLLQPGEIVPTPIDHENKTFDLVASDESWFFVPGSSANFLNLPDLGLVYPVTDLSGFDLPAP